MRKIFSFCSVMFLVFISTSLPVLCRETELLYLVKNANAQNVKDIADFYSRQNNMPVVDSRDFYTNVETSSEKDDFYFISVEQKDTNVLFYFFSPSDKKKICTDILKRFKINGLKYSKLTAKNFDNKYKDFLIKKMSADNAVIQKKEITMPVSYQQSISSANFYDFSDEAQKKYDMHSQLNQHSANMPLTAFAKNNSNSSKTDKTEVFTPVDIPQVYSFANSNKSLSGAVANFAIPENLTINVVLQSTINTASLDQNDRISAILQNDLYINNKLTAKQGSIVYGTIEQTKKAGMAYTSGSIRLVFDKILTTDGEELLLNTEPLVYTNRDSSRGAKISKNIAGAVALGLLTSALGGAISGTDNWEKTLAIGAGAGLLTGGVFVLSASGEDVELTEGTVLTIKTIPAR